MSGRNRFRGLIERAIGTLSRPGGPPPASQAAGGRSRANPRRRGPGPARLEVEWLEPKFVLTPLAPGATLGPGVADGATRAEAMQAAGIVTVTGDRGNIVAVSFVGTTAGAADPGKIVSKSVTGAGPGTPVAVALTDAEIAVVTDGPAFVVATQVDAAGRLSPNTVVPFTLDTVSPAAVAVALGPGVADGATRAEATRAGGIMTVGGESTATVFVTFVGTTGGVGDPSKTVTTFVTGAGAITLTGANLVTLTDGPVDAVAIQRDAAGNWGPNSVVRFVLDTTVPVAPAVVLGPGVADGATLPEALQRAGVVTVSGEATAAISVSFVGTTSGVSDAAKIVTRTVTGRGPGVPVAVTLSDADVRTVIGTGPVSVMASQADPAGNRSPNTTQRFSIVSVVLDFVRVGDAGNRGDSNGFGPGAVSHAYRMGIYEVTIGQYTNFLNAVAKTDTYRLYNPAMGTDLNIAGIRRSGTPGSYAYAAMDNGGPSGNRPITYVSWFDAARFANWMHNGQPSGTQVAATTEDGAYTLRGATSGTAPARNSGARFHIPTADEWYKAAYYKRGGTNAGYWDFATRSSTAPGNVVGVTLNRANYRDRVYSVTQSTYSASRNYLTNVGAFTNSASAYGTFDQSGNVSEWNDLTGAAGSTRGLRGGGWDSPAPELSRSPPAGGLSAPTIENAGTGFRLASRV